MKKAIQRRRRVKRQRSEGDGWSAKGRTSNIQRPTFNVQRELKEKPRNGYGTRSKSRTSNVQRSTPKVFASEASNIQQDAPRNAKDQRYDLEERLLDYAVRIVRLVEALPPTRAGRHIADELLRCGTSPLANHGDVQGAESRKDFIHKLSIRFKEMRESKRWLRLIHRVPLLTPAKVEPLLRETEELIKILSASIKTAEKNKKRSGDAN
jgi:four helix bundle protein